MKISHLIRKIKGRLTRPIDRPESLTEFPHFKHVVNGSTFPLCG